MGILETIKTADDIRALSLSELNQLCRELREQLLTAVSQNGGHLASNLGIVELTVAIHNVFDPMRDRIIYDVGHQCYVHKMLTGRLDRFSTLRQGNGLSGFPKPEESEADAFIAGHASSAVSTALGMARARTLRKENHSIVAVVGDGAMSGGLAFEGLNNAGQSKEPLIIILNDNGIAISRTVGGIARYLTRQRVRPGYYRMKRNYRKVLTALPRGKTIFAATQRWKNSIKSALLHCSVFEDLGLRYLGPVDGHNIQQLSYMLKVARDYREPVLLHVVTQKGRGYPPAEREPNVYHGVGPFDLRSGVQPSGGGFSEAFGESLCRLAGQDARICAITAAMEDGTGLHSFHERFPARFFDEGISEGHCVSMAAGMAKQGLRPVFAVYSTFLQRSYDMLLQDVALLRLPVVLAVDRAGLVGSDGETHNGVFDVGFLRQIPGLTVWSPASYAELNDALAEAFRHDGPSAVRYPRGREGTYRDGGTDAVRELRKGSCVTLLSYGVLINEALAAAELLEKRGISTQVIKLGVLSPIDLSALRDCLGAPKPLVIAEDCVSPGSVGEYLAGVLRDRPVLLRNLGTAFTRQGTVAEQYCRCGLDAHSIAQCAAETCGCE